MTQEIEAKVIENRPMKSRKSTLVNNAFLAAAKIGQAVVYHHQDYVCCSRKAYQNIISAERQRVIEEVKTKIRELPVTEIKQFQVDDFMSGVGHEVTVSVVKLSDLKAAIKSIKTSLTSE